MKAHVRCGALALLLAAACSRPDSDLFGLEDLPPTGTDGSAGGTASAGGPAMTGGTTASGNAGNPAIGGGSTPTAGGGPGDNSVAGKSNVPIDQGMGGEQDGAAGSGETPKPTTEPVCGNGKLETGEQCDDAGHAGEDGCSNACKVVCAHFGADTLESDDHHCYNGYDAADFAGAEEDCARRGGHLVTISSATENELAVAFVNNSKWIGGYEDVAPTVEGVGAYGWVTGEPFTYTNWNEREPDQAKVRCSLGLQTCYEHCVSMDGDGIWSDASCAESDGYVCEWEPAGSK